MPATANDAGQLLVNILDFKQKAFKVTPSQPSAGANDQESRVGTSARDLGSTSKSSHNRKKITLKQKECRCLLAQWKTVELRT